MGKITLIKPFALPKLAHPCQQKFLWQTEHSPSVKCIVLAHYARAPDWSNISLATIANVEWLVRSALCVIDSSQQTNATGSCMLFVKGISAWIIVPWKQNLDQILYDVWNGIPDKIEREAIMLPIKERELTMYIVSSEQFLHLSQHSENVSDIVVKHCDLCYDNQNLPMLFFLTLSFECNTVICAFLWFCRRGNFVF